MRLMRTYLLCLSLAACAFGVVGAADMSSTKNVPKPVGGGVAWTSSEIADLQHALARDLRAQTLVGAQVGLLAIDTVRGTSLFSQNAGQEFIPASNFKLIVGSTALRQLGLTFAYVTTAESSASQSGDTLQGNITLRGGGDALLRASDLTGAAQALYARGIRRIDGDVVVDASHFDSVRYPGGWEWDDLPYYYAPVVSAMELEDGVVHMTMSPGDQIGAPIAVNVSPQTSAFTLDNRITTGSADSKDTSDLLRPWDRPQTIELVGSYPLGAKVSGDLSPAVPDPAQYAGDVFARALASAGIRVTGQVRQATVPPGTVLWSHASEPLAQLLADFWYPSDNLIGELMLKQLGVAHAGEPGTTENGAAAEQVFLHSIGVDVATVDIADGSGLSTYDRITPTDFVAILQSDWNSPYRDVVLDALPVSGVRGTLVHLGANSAIAGVVFAKSGSVSHVRTMSGYVQTKTHGPVTFSFLVNQWMGDSQNGGALALQKVRETIFTDFAIR